VGSVGRSHYVDAMLAIIVGISDSVVHIPCRVLPISWWDSERHPSRDRISVCRHAVGRTQVIEYEGSLWARRPVKPEAGLADNGNHLAVNLYIN
jgi:hypothetical protein